MVLVMKRTLVALGIAGALVLAGCGVGSAGAPSDVADAAIALQQVGFDTGLAGEPKAGTGDAPRKALRKYLRKNTLHGEVAIQTKDGVRTVVVQRGSVTAVTSTSVAVKSTDGFALTWTFGDKLRVVQDKKAVDKSALRTGAEIGIAGVKDGDSSTARLIAVK
jgi:hypothetical protein